MWYGSHRRAARAYILWRAAAGEPELYMVVMIEVKWEFEGDDQGRVAQTAVAKVVRRLQRALGTIVCPVHRRSPALIVRGHMFSTPDIGFDTCCQALMDETTARIHDIRQQPRQLAGS